MDKLFDYKSDMAVEIPLYKAAGRNINGFVMTDMTISGEEQAIYHKDAGRYITFDGTGGYSIPGAAKCIFGALKALVPEFGKALIVGLGNEAMVADALGPLAIKKIIVTRHIYEEMKREYDVGEVAAFCPNVLGVTGIESYDIIQGVVEKVKPDVIICIDSLAGRKTERIGNSFQITDTGISPGSGLGFRRIKLNRQSMGVPVIAVGMPLVVYARTIALDALGKYELSEEEINETVNAVTGNLVVTPKEIDILVDRAAYAVAMGINKYVHKLSDKEIKDLMNDTYM